MSDDKTQSAHNTETACCHSAEPDQNQHVHEHVHEHVHSHEHDHGHSHEHTHSRSHSHAHEHHHAHHHASGHARVLTIRCSSGLSGDIFLTGLARMLELDNDALNALAGRIMPELAGCVRIRRAEVNAVGGWRADIDLPRQHEHRTLADVLHLLEHADITDKARAAASLAFTMLAGVEAEVHGKRPEEVHFHEVGALDSILDTTLGCVLFDLLNPDVFRVSPLPVADGHVVCAHGVLPVPAPAVMKLLHGIPVTPFSGRGETVTPTAVSLLKSLDAEFGPWPAMTVEKHALVYGSRVFENAPNGAIFALGTAL